MMNDGEIFSWIYWLSVISGEEFVQFVHFCADFLWVLPVSQEFFFLNIYSGKLSFVRYILIFSASLGFAFEFSFSY